MLKKYIQLKCKVNNLKLKHRGDINPWIAGLIMTAILILIGYPILKSLFSDVLTSISTWLKAEVAKIFIN